MFVFFLARQPPVGQGLLIHEVSRSHTTTHHNRWDCSGRVISSSQRPLPDKTQHSQRTDILAPAGFEPTTLAGKRPQTYAIDRAATGTGVYIRYTVCRTRYRTRHFFNNFTTNEDIGFHKIQNIKASFL